MTTIADLKKLYTKRNLINKKLEDLEKYANTKFEIKENVLEIQNRINEMPNIRKEFEDINFEILVFEEDDPEKLENSQADLKAATLFENKWYKVLSSLQSLLLTSPSSSLTPPVENINNTENTSKFNVRLPVINLPEFNGEYKNWMPFFDAFESLIHQNNTIDNTQKFHYLKSCLKGEAARSIESLTISNNNYNSAWQILQKRYKNTRLIIQEHVQAILNSPEITKCTSINLRKLTNDINSNLEALKVLEIPVNSWDAIICNIILQKLDYQTRKEFESTLGTEPIKTKDMIEFLEKKCIVLESMNRNTNNSKQKFNANENDKKRTFRSSTVVTKKYSCYYCKNQHSIMQCEKFLKLNINQRKQEIEKRNLCKNCLRNNHETSQCKATGCSKCQSTQHHTLLHEFNGNNHFNENSQENLSRNVSAGTNKTTNFEPLTVLSTAIVLLKDADGKFQKCRCLLDAGSEVNIITQETCQRLNLPTKNSQISISGINKICSNSLSITTVYIKSLYTNFNTVIDCCILEKATTSLPTISFDKSHLKIPDDILLSDTNFNENGPIDLLLGVNVFWKVMTGDIMKIEKQNLYLIRSLFGWLVGGEVQRNIMQNRKYSCNFVGQNDLKILNTAVEKFWIQEEFPNEQNKTLSKEEKKCEEHFLNTTIFDKNLKRFIIELPFKNNIVNLGNSKTIALKRFLSLERKFKKNEDFQKEYSNAFQEMINSGIIEEVPEEEYDRENVFYLPHSGVYKNSDISKKLRIVYDGSAKSDNGISLNDNLMTGPNIQNDLSELLIRFRTHEIVLCSDMQKMFQQVLVCKKHTDYQRLLWRNSEHDDIKIFRLTRVVFGLTNSPYTAMRCVRQLAKEYFNDFPEASNVLINDIYMDDILTGGPNLKRVINLRENLINILSKANFTLSKWISNNTNALPAISNKESNILLNLDKEENSKVLGLWWNPRKDCFIFKVNIEIPEHLTKRKILSSIAKLFDPIGLIIPVITKAKLIMQELWAIKLDWDDKIPEQLEESWKKYALELSQLNELCLIRKLGRNLNDPVDLIAFCDASTKAYGALIYLRSQNQDGSFDVNLICGKSRVSPLKVITLPRLELSAALLAAQLMEKVSKCLNLQINKKYFFTDSTITLHYIYSNPSTWQVYVANRISQIQNLSDPENWNHIKSEQNPADFVSRGCYPRKILNSSLYWYGPDFLKEENANWPISCFKPSQKQKDIPEFRKIRRCLTISIDKDILTKFSSFSKLVNIIALCKRFIDNLRCESKNKKRTGLISTEEILTAKNIIYKMVQQETLNPELSDLKLMKTVSKNSKIYALDPFIDEKGIIRVGGRIRQAMLSFNIKHPIILPANHHVTKLLIKLEHLSLFHAGANQTLSSLRRNYWLIGGKNEVKRVIHSCIVCFRNSPIISQQKMGDLPKHRLEPCKPFQRVGVDYFGPIYIKYGAKRSKAKSKAWIALFICMVTRAVHMEVVLDLTSQSFINALKRMVARRGKVSDIYCDNATTFVGAKREIKEIYDFLCSNQTQKEINQYLITESISWNFIPPRAPNFGGLWERIIRSAKAHMKKVVNNNILTYEQAITLFTQIESILNSRPLTPLNNNPDDFHALTPFHFLIGEPSTELPELNYDNVPDNRLSSWEKIQKIKRNFWKRWSREVLPLYQPRSKWKNQTPVPEIGAMVLLVEDTPPMIWKLGRIEELHPGPDGLPRVAVVRTSQGVYKRSLRKLAVLPSDV